MAKPRGSAPYKKAGGGAGKVAERYTHPEQTSPLRPDVGTQPQFRKKKPPATYRYDSSVSPSLEWDGQNGTREIGEWLLTLIERAASSPDTFAAPQELTFADGAVALRVASLAEAVRHLKRLSKPFLNWAGKAERLSFDVPTLPLFVHERLSTKAIVDTLVAHRSDKQIDLYDLFGDPRHSIIDQTLRAYEYQDKWVNRMVLGDSLVVMNSLLQYEGLGGQVQMIYIDPPYGVKFGSNFQPFVRRRDVSHGDDEDLTREPEMVKAYRDTWELGLHSYLTYMRDRLLLARDLLTASGSVFVQISDENLHHVRELMDEVFGAENFAGIIAFKKASSQTSELLTSTSDFLLWYGRDRSRVKYRQLYLDKALGEETAIEYTFLLGPNGERRPMTKDEREKPELIPIGWRVFRPSPLTSQGYRVNTTVPFEFEGKTYHPGAESNWKTTVEGLQRLAASGRLMPRATSLSYIRLIDDFPVAAVGNIWEDTKWGFDAGDKAYVIQTNTKVVQRCILMTTDPGDLVLDPTCGSGTTAYVAEQWGRRWITIDTSRVPLALARQRLLTATYSYYQLKDEKRGPAGGFVYVRKQNKKGEEVGGIVPHVTLKSIANNEPPDEEVLVDRPEVDNKIVRVTGPFAVEATIPTPVDWEGDGVEDGGAENPPYRPSEESYGSFVDRMIEVLRRSPVLHVGGGKTVQVANVRQPAKALSLSAEAIVPELDNSKPGARSPEPEARSPKPVAFVFGPENGAISEQLVHAALKEANLKGYTHLYVIGFAIQPHARDLIENASAVGLLPATYVQATPDLMMGDLLKNMRSSQIFSVCGLPEVKIHKIKPQKKDDPTKYQVELIGLDTFDPSTMEVDHRNGDDVPAWFVDTDYNNLCFHVTQAFFPRTGAWNDLRKALKGDYDDSVWDHLAGRMSAPFDAGEHRHIAVKVIDDRGNELLVIRSLP
ncbi:MAG: site-specific DNA-methyltransferase [Acidobacteria bacterium]|nr:MAG: site-specific DNA-methyltransferase [Acidobacteriota bacterium]